MNTDELKNNLKNNMYRTELSQLYCVNEKDTDFFARRFLKVTESYEKTFGSNKNINLFSSPGRTELGGNHTDHQHGCVLAASINLDIIACAAPNGTNRIRIQSENFSCDEISSNDLDVNLEEVGTSKALIRGIAAKFKEMGCDIAGFNAYTDSNVLKGSGLSSSAAFEVLIGNIINSLFCDGKVSDTEIAQIGQFAENVHFGKPCGLMDQMASSLGSTVYIDFAEEPVVEKINFDFNSSGYSLCIIDTGADHANLTDEYTAIPYEMGIIAGYFNQKYLRNVKKGDFLKEIPNLRKSAGDRAVMRALHFFNENKRAYEEAKALKDGNFDNFLDLINESGRSSYMYLQNVSVPGSVEEQSAALALCLCDEFLKGKGAFRIHGGGFAGTIQAFVPCGILEDFQAKIENILGKGKCHVLKVRPAGGIELKI